MEAYQSGAAIAAERVWHWKAPRLALPERQARVTHGDIAIVEGEPASAPQAPSLECRLDFTNSADLLPPAREHFKSVERFERPVYITPRTTVRIPAYLKRS